MGFDEGVSQDLKGEGDVRTEDDTESLPDPDAEGRKIAESQEVGLWLHDVYKAAA